MGALGHRMEGGRSEGGESPAQLCPEECGRAGAPSSLLMGTPPQGSWALACRPLQRLWSTGTSTDSPALAMILAGLGGTC